MCDQPSGAGNRQCRRQCHRNPLCAPAADTGSHLRCACAATVNDYAPPLGSAGTLVTQTRLREGMAEEFSQWQSAISAAAAEFPGFITQSVLPPNPPLQVDWVIQQRFANVEAASIWLRSERRIRLLDTVQPMLTGPDDVHLVRDNATGVRPVPVSAVISSRVRP